MTVKYLYIDDEHESSDSYKSAVERADKSLEIDYSTPLLFDYQIRQFVDNLDKYDGLILDWRLDQVVNQEHERVSFHAGTLAQEVRTRGSERTEGADRGLKEIPIVLWSTRERLDKSFYGDSTSSDLFDRIHHKNDVIDNTIPVANELVALADGYNKIRNGNLSSLGSIVELPDDLAEYIDIRFLQRFSGVGDISVHDVARFILKQAILTPGVLIDEPLLAARLGVDRDKSTDWPKLLSMLESAAYSGPFAGAWPRWWNALVQDKWWYSLPVKRHTSLSSMDAIQRVAQLKSIFNLDLVPAVPIMEGYSSCFQTLCAVSGEPLDPLDGVVVGDREPLPWQDAQYISIEAAVKRLNESSQPPIRLHPTEVARVKQIRAVRIQNAEN